MTNARSSYLRGIRPLSDLLIKLAMVRHRRLNPYEVKALDFEIARAKREVRDARDKANEARETTIEPEPPHGWD